MAISIGTLATPLPQRRFFFCSCFGDELARASAGHAARYG